jgi:pimeloyl-ACP methyl ester carboxylesterase
MVALSSNQYLFLTSPPYYLFMFCEVDGVNIYYEATGEGYPILMLHGYGIDHHVMTGCMEPIFKKRPGYKRIYMDLPGMGRSKAPGWLENTDQVLDIIIRFSEKVIPENDFLVAGESYGGYLARGMVHKIPERLGGVLLICPVMVGDRSKRQLPPRRVFVRDEKLLAGIDPEVRKFFERMLLLLDKRRWERFQQDILPGRRVMDTAFLERLKKHGYECSFDVDRIKPFDRPSLILVGRQDASVGYKDALKLIDNYSRGTFAILDRAGHGLEVEQENVFNCLVSEWLDRVEENRGGP